MDRSIATKFIEATWQDAILPTLTDYVAIPAKSPAFDPDWESRGELERAVQLVHDWCVDHAASGWQIEIVRLPGRTPVIWMDIPGQGDDRVLLYGHVDKQPEMAGWEPDLGPWKPVLRDDRLYGRGGADDGYAAFASITALRLLGELGLPHPPCAVLIEACEESGSYDLPFYIEHLAERIGRPSLVVCLDSGCGNYDQLWCTTSLRGLVSGTLEVEILREGVHSGDASGIVPSSFRLARQLLSRLEDESSGEILLPELRAEIPEDRRAQAERAAAVLGSEVYRRFPFAEKGQFSETGAELVLNRTWRPFLEVVGASGLPALADAGNVLRPSTELKLSIRLAPTTDPERACRAVRECLEKNPEPGAAVRFVADAAAPGWNAPALSPWLEALLQNASDTWFERPAVMMGEGGTIPFMGMLGERFPEAQFVITGVLGPGSNAHGPNEFLHLPTAKRLTGCVAQILAEHPSVAG